MNGHILAGGFSHTDALVYEVNSLQAMGRSDSMMAHREDAEVWGRLH